MGIFLLSEKPTILQWSGTFLFIVGILVYFYPVNLPPGRVLGIAAILIGVFANAASSILGRGINRTGKFDPVTVTLISMGVGSIVMLVIGITSQGLPSISFTNILFLFWLAIVNTAFAFTIWNLTFCNLIW